MSATVEPVVLQSLEVLAGAVRAMTAVGADSSQGNTSITNALARPHHGSLCRICHLPGHHSDHISQADACLTEILKLFEFWDEMKTHILFLYSFHDPFKAAIDEQEPTYEMRLNSSPLRGQTFEQIYVNRLTSNYLKFQAHFARIRAKAVYLMSAKEAEYYGAVVEDLNDVLLKGKTLSLLFEQSVVAADLLKQMGWQKRTVIDGMGGAVSGGMGALIAP
ncbi:hypothetical protein BU24DRAFT_459026 [Aaosphaeria arxii CBS 175.79]|uniref:Uncharacterized protein n=1 Tax=Aaosphaeria arxii CBS 175.79 TaxID=1450172 RepID=A0A6A5Y389_9PLEO|nr:uncharacterized protein BU24DRAFT_459026 [Aaosphaeria arxii CBS 175.79]KAF2019341.1 hypothetical protein BU24DRAFT_459026 [Aaosphaeria arxii CBS 175.79]